MDVRRFLGSTYRGVKAFSPAFSKPAKPARIGWNAGADARVLKKTKVRRGGRQRGGKRGTATDPRPAPGFSRAGSPADSHRTPAVPGSLSCRGSSDNSWGEIIAKRRADGRTV